MQGTSRLEASDEASDSCSPSPRLTRHTMSMLRTSVHTLSRAAPRSRPASAAAGSAACSSYRSFASSSRSAAPDSSATPAAGKQQQPGQQRSQAETAPAAAPRTTTDLLNLFDTIQDLPAAETVDPASQSTRALRTLFSLLWRLTPGRPSHRRRSSLGPATPEPRPGHLAPATLAAAPPAAVPSPPRLQPSLPARSANRVRAHARPVHPVRHRPRRGQPAEPGPLERVCHEHGKDQAEGQDGIAAQDAAQGRKGDPESARESGRAFGSLRASNWTDRRGDLGVSQSMGIMPTFGISVPGAGREQ